MSKRSASIGTRLSRVVVLAVLAGILASVSFFMLNEYRQTVLAEQARLKSAAAAFAAAAAPSVRIGDQRGILLVLRGIREMPEVLYVAARDADGTIVAEIGGVATLDGRDRTLADADLFSMLSAQKLKTTVDIRDGGRVIGSLSLTADISSLRGRYVDALKISVFFAVVLMLITSLLARAKIAQIIRPLGMLAGEFADIGRRSDLTRRLANDRSDEVGVLIDAFNEMFSHIDQRDRQLQRHRDTLELTVEERTAELRVAKEDAERANAAKSDFLATMSHEIRTPMNGMMVMAEMLSAAPLSPKHLRYAEVISRSGRGLLSIINDILDFSKIEAGMMTLESIPFSLDSVLEDTVSLFAERAREKGLSVALYVAPEAPHMLFGDPTRIGQVVGNLVNNALKFTERGGVTIEAMMQPGSAPDMAGIEIHVRDTGIGIAADKIAAIFERFSQADQTITRRFGGTGLGLSISRKLVEAMGGEISVASQPGRGSDFFFRIDLPIAEAGARAARLDGKTLLVTAANEITQKSVEQALLARGARLVTGAEGEPDACLVQTGVELDAELRGRPVVALRPFAAASARMSDAGSPVGELALPLSRRELEDFAHAALTGDWTRLSERGRDRRQAESMPDLGHLRVLAVDDTPVNREVLSEALSGFGIAPELAESGREAIERASERPFDVIFMDCSMPDMDGFAATAAIRKMEAQLGRPAAFIVALTAHVTGREAERWREAGMNAYVAKPFTIAQIAAALDARSSTEPAAAQPPADKPHEAAGDDFASVPLLSPETLAMFESLSAAKGSALAERVFGLFGRHAPQALADLKNSLGGPADEAARLAHALKSICLSAGGSRAGALCAMIEEQAKAGAAVSELSIAELEEVLAATDASMASHLADSRPEMPDVVRSA